MITNLKKLPKAVAWARVVATGIEPTEALAIVFSWNRRVKTVRWPGHPALVRIYLN
jgi:hypothetical protein